MMTQEAKVTKVNASHRAIHTEIIIDAPPQEVWKALTDFEKMPTWSSSLKKITGDFRDGGAITVFFKTNPDKEKVGEYKHTLIMREGEYFGWKGDVFAMGMTDNHLFKLEEMGDGKTRFIQSDEAKDGMTWLLGGTVMKRFANWYTEFNEELKREVEKK